MQTVSSSSELDDNTVLDETTLAPMTLPPTEATTTVVRSTTTVLPLSQPPSTTTQRTTTGFPSTTFLPTLFSTILSTLRGRPASTQPPPTTTMEPVQQTTTTTTTPIAIITAQPSEIVPVFTTIRSPVTTTLPVVNVRELRGLLEAMMKAEQAITTTTTALPTTLLPRSITTDRQGLYTTVVNSNNNKQRQYTEQQLKDLATLAELEREQADLIKQLSLLTNLVNLHILFLLLI